jgi:hypothetical protein
VGEERRIICDKDVDDTANNTVARFNLACVRMLGTSSASTPATIPQKIQLPTITHY